jgi:hypothetical protein
MTWKQVRPVGPLLILPLVANTYSHCGTGGGEYGGRDFSKVTRRPRRGRPRHEAA